MSMENCPVCNHPLSLEERISLLEKEVARLNAELAAEKAKFKWPYSPNVWSPIKYGDGTGPLSNGTAVPPKEGPDVVITCQNCVDLVKG